MKKFLPSLVLAATTLGCAPKAIDIGSEGTESNPTLLVRDTLKCLMGKTDPASPPTAYHRLNFDDGKRSYNASFNLEYDYLLQIEEHAPDGKSYQREGDVPPFGYERRPIDGKVDYGATPETNERVVRECNGEGMEPAQRMDCAISIFEENREENQKRYRRMLEGILSACERQLN